MGPAVPFIPAIIGAVGGAVGAATAGDNTKSAASIYNAVNPDQIGSAYTSTQDAFQQQMELLHALQAQGGIQNQRDVYGQLQQIVQGGGPNPAQAMLNNATGQNIANQAALAAGQRGGAQNVGMLARQAGQVGANAQQQAVGQGANLQAQQALGALQAAGNLANTQTQQQMQATQQNTANRTGLYNTLLGANNAQNQFSLENQRMFHEANKKEGGGGGLLGGLLNAAGPILGMIGGGGGGGGGGLAGGGGQRGVSQMPAQAEGGMIHKQIGRAHV